jgi:transposase
MVYREVGRMDIMEVMRRWQAGDSRRAIARGSGLARDTVKKYLLAAQAAGVTRHGPPPTEAQLAQLASLNRVARAGPARMAPQQARLEPYREEIARWLRRDDLQLTRVQELLDQRRVPVAYTTLRRFVRQAGLGAPPRSTVRMADTAPGEVAEFDFGRLGPLLDPATGRRQIVWALVVVLAYSRHCFVWPLVHQTVEAVIEGLEAAWAFFGGSPQRLVLDNFPAAVAGTDPLAPRPTRAFLEYSQARGFLVDPARVRHPQDKPRVERGITYVRERFWKGGDFVDLADARTQATRWCREVAGQRVHGTTRRLPLIVFEDEERARLLPAPAVPYDVPRWANVTVHPDHHISFQHGLYSVPATTCPPGTKLEVRGDRALVRLYHRGELVKVHPRQPRGGRATDPDDYPPERAAYALRAPDRLIRQAQALGSHVGQFAARLLAGSLPWAKLRQGQKLLRLGERYTPARLDAACARALGFDLIDVQRVERILVLALEREGLPRPPAEDRVRPVPSSRFARPGVAFDHRHAPGQPPTAQTGPRAPAGAAAEDQP